MLADILHNHQNAGPPSIPLQSLESIIGHSGYGQPESYVVVEPSVQFTPPNIQLPPESNVTVPKPCIFICP